MGGHSHWAGIKHKKAAVDAKKGKIFTKIIREITIAAKMSGGDMETNARLRKAVDDAKAANMPAENIKRGIQKGTGQLPGATYEELTYEGYGPSKIAVIVETTTDNKNRTFSEIRKIFENSGGNIGSTGCVSYMFQKKGYLTVKKAAMSEDDLMGIALEAGAEDVRNPEECDYYEVITSFDGFDAVKKELENRKIAIDSSEQTMLPDTEVMIEDKEAAEKIVNFIETLESHDDTKNIYANFNIPDTLLAEIDD
ncbi:MAG: YebC/PmpR family DNA-binding transcriptional regulator [Elusimicrobiaceae bacterium]